MALYTDDAGIVYMGRFPNPVNQSTAEVEIPSLFESRAANSSIYDSSRFLLFSFDGEPVGGSDYHVFLDRASLGDIKISTRVSSQGGQVGSNVSNSATFSNNMYGVFGNGVLAWFVGGEENLFILGQPDVSAFPSPLNRFFVDTGKSVGFWVSQVDANFLSDLYVTEPEASFPINCSGGGTADATWLKLLDQQSGKAMGICEGTVMQTEGTNFNVGEVVQVDAPLPDGGSRIFICAGSWGDDGQALMRMAPLDAPFFNNN